MCPLNIKIVTIDFYRLIIDKILNVKTDSYKTI